MTIRAMTMRAMTIRAMTMRAMTIRAITIRTEPERDSRQNETLRHFTIVARQSPSRHDTEVMTQSAWPYRNGDIA
jgi:hypothetical protein